MKYVLKCVNGDCSNKGKSFPPGKFRMKYNKKLKKVVPELCSAIDGVCPECGAPMEFFEVENNIPEFSVSTFKGLPDDKKKEILRKRFDKDMKRNGRDEMESRKKSTISKMIGYDKH